MKRFLSAFIVGAFGLLALLDAGGCRRSPVTIETTGAAEIPWQDNLLLREGVVLASSSHNLENERVENLLEEEPFKFWHVDLKMLGLPAWVEADFGEGNAVVATSLAAYPRVDRPDRLFGGQFFRQARIDASTDGLTWTTLAWIYQGLPEQAQWYRCDFINEEAYRFYRLLIIDGHDGDRKHFLSLSKLALF